MLDTPRLLLVDDDAPVRDALADALKRLMSIPVRGVGSVTAALAATLDERFVGAIIDVGLPDGDGRDLCVTFREQGLTMPILMLTGFGQEMDIVRGLDSGANDYVVKPFRPQEIAARLRAQLRLHEVSEHAEMRIGLFVFRPGDKTLAEAGQSRPVHLTEKEAAVLKYLYRAGGAMVSREELLHQVWGYSDTAATHTVETHVYRLRRKVEPRVDSPRVLLHERGGYRLLRADLPPPMKLARGSARLVAKPSREDGLHPTGQPRHPFRRGV